MGAPEGKAPARNGYLDFVKGIAIILVALGHSVQCGSGEAFRSGALFYEDSLFRFIYAFHMPLFMLVSGYVVCWSLGRRSFRETARRQFRSLVVPCVCWTLLYQALLLQKAGGRFDLEWLSGLPTLLLRGNWFLWAVFWSSMAAVAVFSWGRQTPPPRTHFRAFFLLFLTGPLLLLPNGFLENGYEYVFVYPYFALGFLANRYGLLSRMGKRLHGICFAASVILFILLFPRFHYSAYVYTTMTCVLTAADPLRQFLIDGYRWAVGLAGCAAVLYLLWGAWKIAPDWLRRPALWLGKRTLGLYVVSVYLDVQLLTAVSREWTPSYLCNVLETVVILALSALIVYLLEGWHWTRQIFLGRWDD